MNAFALYTVLGGMLLVALAAIVFTIRKNGALAEQVSQKQEVVENVEEAKEVSDDLSRLSDDDRRKRLREWSRE